MSILLIVVGVLSLIIGAIIALSSVTLYEYERARFLRLGLIFLAGGTGALILRFLCITVPDILNDRASETARRRKAFFRNQQRPKPTPRAPGNVESGSILILTLILLGLVSAVAVRVMVEARRAQMESAASMTMGMLKLVAIDTARTAMQKLADDVDLDVDHPGESWAEYVELNDPAGFSRMMRISDAQSMFDLNNMAVDVTGDIHPPRDILANIMMLSRQYMPSLQIDALRDWVDADVAGAYESLHYEAMNPPAVIANRILFGVDELMLVEGWSQAMLERRTDLPRGMLMEANLVENTTILPVVRSRVIPMNINTANPVALLGVLGIGRDGIVERVLARRREQPFRGTGILAEWLGPAEYQRISPYLDVKSRFFHIQATAYHDGKTARIYLLAERADDGEVNAVQAFF